MDVEDEQRFLWRLFKEAKEYKGTLTQGIDYYVFYLDRDGDGEEREELVGRIKMPDYTTHEQYKENHPLVQNIVAQKLHAYCRLLHRRKESLSLRRMMNHFPVTYIPVSDKTLQELGMK